MNAYRDRVSAAAVAGRTGVSEPVPNLDGPHAAILAEYLFREAQHTVDMITENLFVPIYGGGAVIEPVVAFLKNDGKMRILVEKPDQLDFATHPLIQRIKAENLMGQVTTKTVPPSLQAQYNFNCLIVDHRSYRLEADRSVYEATGIFGDEEFAKKLTTVFETIWAQSPPLPLGEHAHHNGHLGAVLAEEGTLGNG